MTFAVSESRMTQPCTTIGKALFKMVRIDEEFAQVAGDAEHDTVRFPVEVT